MKHFLLFALTLALSESNAQMNTEYFVHVDPVSGTHTRIDSIPGVEWIAIGPSYSTVDSKNNIYYFKGGDNANNWHLYGINGSTGATISKTALSSNVGAFTNIGAFEYDDSTALIYGYAWDQSQNKEHFITYDPSNGQLSSKSVIPGANFIVLCENTYDQKKHEFYFQGIDTANVQRLYRINSLTGVVVSSPSINPSTGLVHIRVNSANGKLYGFVMGSGGRTLCQVDPLTALPVATLAVFPNMAGFNQMPNFCSIDEANNRFTFQHSGSTTELTTVDLSNGNILHHPVFPVGLISGENVIELRYQKNTSLLLGLHYGKVAATTVSLKNFGMNKHALTVYPNPISNTAEITVTSNEEDLILLVYDQTGARKRIELMPSHSRYLFERKELTAGVYQLVVMNRPGERSVKTIVID